jgi:hypothetical protein
VLYLTEYVIGNGFVETVIIIVYFLSGFVETVIIIVYFLSLLFSATKLSCNIFLCFLFYIPDVSFKIMYHHIFLN